MIKASGFIFVLHDQREAHTEVPYFWVYSSYKFGAWQISILLTVIVLIGLKLNKKWSLNSKPLALLLWRLSELLVYNLYQKYCQTSPNKNKWPNLWHVTSILVCCIFDLYIHTFRKKYRLWSFKTRDTKLERFLHKNQLTQRKLLNFENWTNGEPQ